MKPQQPAVRMEFQIEWISFIEKTLEIFDEYGANLSKVTVLER